MADPNPNTIYTIPTAHSSTSSLSSTTSDLPFPTPLARSQFLSPQFTPSSFLSSLTTRFQTLEDLRAELAQLSSTIEAELVDLVNDNYSDFLSLGSSLAGGEEKVEEVRVGVMGFGREIEGLRGKVEGERWKVAEALEGKRRVMREVGVGRGLLEVERRVGDLEGELGLREKGRAVLVREKGGVEDEEDEGVEDVDWGVEWDDEVLDEDEMEEDREEGAVPPRLRRKIEKFLVIKALCERFGRDHPFLVAEQGRIRKVRETVLLDIDAAIRAESDVKGKQAILRLRSEVEE